MKVQRDYEKATGKTRLKSQQAGERSILRRKEKEWEFVVQTTDRYWEHWTTDPLNYPNFHT